MIRYPILSIASSRSTLAGSAMGRQMLAMLIGETKMVTEPSVAFLDFYGVDIATGSFLREAVLGFRDFSRNAIGMLYPVVANANAMIEEELSDYLADRTDAMWACELTDVRGPSNVHLLGALDSAHAKTLRFIAEHRLISAPELAKLHPDEGVGPTAWNNRLAALSSKGIVMEMKSGKTKTFTPVLAAA